MESNALFIIEFDTSYKEAGVEEINDLVENILLFKEQNNCQNLFLYLIDTDNFKDSTEFIKLLGKCLKKTGISFHFLNVPNFKLIKLVFINEIISNMFNLKKVGLVSQTITPSDFTEIKQNDKLQLIIPNAGYNDISLKASCSKEIGVKGINKAMEFIQIPEKVYEEDKNIKNKEYALK